MLLDAADDPISPPWLVVDGLIALILEQVTVDGLPHVLVEVDPRYFRPTEVDHLLGDPSKARRRLGWKHKLSFDQLVGDMVQADLVAILEEQQRQNRHA